MSRPRLGYRLAAIVVAGLTGLLPDAGPRAATVTVDASEIGHLIANDQFGANMSVGDDIANPPGQPGLLGGVGIHLIRWPGGIPSDLYHWQSNTWSTCAPFGGQPNPNSTFDDFETNFVQPGGFDVAITVNYGTNADCTGPADPNEAAAWVDYANNQHHYGVKYWTVGNEVYWSMTEPDLHSPGAHDPTTYAENVATQFYPLIKAKDPTALVGVVLAGPASVSGLADWDSIVLANAKYDFGEIHVYPQRQGSENDRFLLTRGPAVYARYFSLVRKEAAAAGHPHLPILLGEYNSDAGDPDKQSLSIVNALFIGMVQGEILRAGIPLATIQIGLTAVCAEGNNPPSLYGWQDFGTFSLFAKLVPNPYQCPDAEPVPFGTPFPSARAFALSAKFGVPGNHMLAVTVDKSLRKVRAYAAQQGNGYALMLFNLAKERMATVSVDVVHAGGRVFAADLSTYDKAIYDQSMQGVWAGPTETQLGKIALPLRVRLSPWSMNLLLFRHP